MTRTILIAEDRDASRELVRTVLLSAGYQVLEARDGREAIDLALGSHVDLVLLDLHMPHTDGFGVLERLRAEDRYRATPIVALTASAMAGDSERAIARGFTSYISKPVTMLELRTKVGKLLGEGSR